MAISFTLDGFTGGTGVMALFSPGNADRSASSARASFDAEAMPHLNDLFRTALRVTGDRARAEDAVQEAYLQAVPDPLSLHPAPPPQVVPFSGS